MPGNTHYQRAKAIAARWQQASRSRLQLANLSSSILDKVCNATQVLHCINLRVESQRVHAAWRRTVSSQHARNPVTPVKVMLLTEAGKTSRVSYQLAVLRKSVLLSVTPTWQDLSNMQACSTQQGARYQPPSLQPQQQLPSTAPAMD